MSDKNSRVKNLVRLISISKSDDQINECINRMKNINMKIYKKRSIVGTPLLYAVYYRNTPLIKRLINMGCDIDFKDNAKRTALFYASRTGNIIALNELVKAGADIDAIDVNGDNVLAYTCSNFNSKTTLSHIGIVERLIDLGCNVNNINKEKENPLILAVKNCQNEDVNLISTLLERGANTEQCNNILWSALEYAMRGEKINIVRLLLEYGADPNVKIKSEWSLLMNTAKFAGNPIQYEMTKLFLENGADVNFQYSSDYGEYTALNVAVVHSARSSSLDCIKLLLSYGANIMHADKNKRTAIHMLIDSCCTYEEYETVLYLLAVIPEQHKISFYTELLFYILKLNKVEYRPYTELIRNAVKLHLTINSSCEVKLHSLNL